MKKNKKLITIGCIIAIAILLILIVAIKTTVLVSKVDIENPNFDEELFKNKTPYIGDNSKVSKIVNMLPFGENIKYHGIKLETDDDKIKEINIIVSLPSEDESLTKIEENKFDLNSMLMFSLIKNLEKINISINKNGGLESISSRDIDWANRVFLNPYENTNTLEEFKEFKESLLNTDFAIIPIYSDDLEESIKNTIIQKNKEIFFGGEFSTESHTTLGTKKESNKIICYVYSKFASFQFENSIFEKCSENTSPYKLVFEKDRFSNYVLSSYEDPKETGYYEVRIQEIFPDDIIEKINELDKSQEKQDVLKSEILAETKSYLEQLGLENAKISFEPVEKTYPTIGEKNFEEYEILYRAYKDFPYYIGTKEILKNGTRFEYKTDYEKKEDSDIVSYTKTNLKNEEVEEHVTVSIKSGKLTVLDGKLRKEYEEAKKDFCQN